MFSDVILLFLGCGLGASLMKAAVDYKDKHVRAEMAKTEHYRTRYEQARVSIAQYSASAHLPVATPNNDTDEAPLPLNLFTNEDQEALNQGRRVVHVRMGGAK